MDSNSNGSVETLHEFLNKIRKCIIQIANVHSDWDGYDGYYRYSHENVSDYTRRLESQLSKAQQHCLDNPELCEFKSSKQFMKWRTKEGDEYSIKLHKDRVQVEEDADLDGSTSIVTYGFKQ